MILLFLAACGSTTIRFPGDGGEVTGLNDSAEAGGDTGGDRGDTAAPVDEPEIPAVCVASSWTWGSTLTVDEADGSFVGEHADEGAGIWIGTPGDLDGDAVGDLLVGAPFLSDAFAEQGGVYIASGVGARDRGQELGGWPKIHGPGVRTQLARTLTPGDLNGDGLADFIVQPGFQAVQPSEELYVFHGRASGWSGVDGLEDADATIADASPDCQGCVDDENPRIGDVDGDGNDDWLMTVVNDRNGQALVFPGSAAGYVPAPSGALGWVIGDADDLWFTAIGDADGDGLGDLAGAEVSGSETFVMLGAQVTADGAAARTVASLTVSGTPGFPVNVGDLDGDARAELVLTDPSFGVSIFLGARTTWVGAASSGDASVRITGADAFTWVAPIGDVNGDRIPDLAVLAKLAPSGNDTTGNDAFVFFGRASWPAELDVSEADVYIDLPADSSAIQELVQLPTSEMLGDLNGDLIDDLVLRMPNEHTLAPSGGVVFVFLGRSTWEPTVDATAADLTLLGDVIYQQTGNTHMLAVEDLDGDGCDDLLSSSYYHPLVGAQLRGEVFVFNGQN